MDKQILSRVDSVDSLEEGGQLSPAAMTKSSSRLISTKCGVILAVVGILVVLVSCAAVMAAVGASQALGAKAQESDRPQMETTGDPLMETSVKEELMKKVI